MPYAVVDTEYSKELRKNGEEDAPEEGGCVYCWMILKNLVLGQMYKVFVVFLLTVVLLAQYYLIHCKMSGGQYVSKGLRLPKTLDFNFLNAVPTDVFQFAQEKGRIWKMPEK